MVINLKTREYLLCVDKIIKNKMNLGGIKSEKFFLLKSYKNIKKCNYFAIKTTSFESKDIIENINKGIKEYIKSLNYQLLKLPIIEEYYKDFVEILIPIT